MTNINSTLKGCKQAEVKLKLSVMVC